MITLSKSEITPHILRATKFRSTFNTPNSENIKNQYFYRIMIFTHGSATVITNTFTDVCKKNDVLYLLPDTPYKILNTHGEFEVLNIYFDYFDNLCTNNDYIYKTLYQTEFNKKYCQKLYHFGDAPKLNKPCIIHNNINIADFALKIFSEFTKSVNSSKRLVSLLMSCITEEMCRENMPPSQTDGKYEKLINYIQENCNAKITADDLAKKFHYHKNHINRIIKLSTGMNLKTFILKSKIEMADRLFEETNMNVTEIANYLNFFDASHFLKTYKKVKDKNAD